MKKISFMLRTEKLYIKWNYFLIICKHQLLVLLRKNKYTTIHGGTGVESVPVSESFSHADTLEVCCHFLIIVYWCQLWNTCEAKDNQSIKVFKECLHTKTLKFSISTIVKDSTTSRSNSILISYPIRWLKESTTVVESFSTSGHGSPSLCLKTSSTEEKVSFIYIKIKKSVSWNSQIHLALNTWNPSTIITALQLPFSEFLVISYLIVVYLHSTKSYMYTYI